MNNLQNNQKNYNFNNKININQQKFNIMLVQLDIYIVKY